MTLARRQGWQDIRDAIRVLILDGTYGPGDKLPRDEDLAIRFNCARSTIQRAMRALSDAGLIERRRKGGTTVRTHPVDRATVTIPVVRVEIEQRGATYGYQLIGRRKARTPPAVTANFGLAQPETMLQVEALHLADGRPYIYEDRWISLRTVPEIDQVDLETFSANEWLVQNRPYSQCDVRIFARNASAAEARLLDVNSDAALLVVERTTWLGSAPITSVRNSAVPGYQMKAKI